MVKMIEFRTFSVMGLVAAVLVVALMSSPATATTNYNDGAPAFCKQKAYGADPCAWYNKEAKEKDKKAKEAKKDDKDKDKDTGHDKKKGKGHDEHGNGNGYGHDDDHACYGDTCGGGAPTGGGDSIPTTTVSEPASAALLGIGLMGLFFAGQARHKRKNKTS